MAEWGRARGRSDTFPPGIAGTGRPAGLPWWRGEADRAGAAADEVRRWLVAEVAPGRLGHWLPVAFGAGIVVYFTAEREPLWWAALALTLALSAAAIAVRARPLAFPLVLALAAAAAGFATATIRTLAIAHPVLRHAAFGVDIAGWVEAREERARSDRITLRVGSIEGRRLDEVPERLRLSVRKKTMPPVGAYVVLKARLSPPLTPLRPGGYDFARDMFFQRIGASGFVLGEIRIAEPPAAAGFWLRYAAFIEGIRDRVDERIRAVLPGDAGSIASALLTGKRDAISTPVNDAMYVSSLAHVLSISGYHMAVVAGIVFFIVRGALALIPAVALRHPVKKWAALAALAVATFYLLLSGAEVATQRSYYMIAIVLGGVLIDRAVLTFRTLAIAAIAVLLLAPEAVVHPSFQMSFAATMALIAGYQNGLPWKLTDADTSRGARIALWGVDHIASLLFASLLAGLATTPYAAFHFHRTAPYGVIANLLAMPVVSALVMPAGLVALVAMPFGFDGMFWKLMGYGIEWMDAVALWVAGLPGAVGRTAAFGTGPLLVCTAGMLVICLLRTPLRWCGVAVVAAAAVWALATPQPDVLIAPDGDPVAVRTAGGSLAIIKKGGDAFTVKEWLLADADPRVPGDPSLTAGVSCDDIGCIARLADGAIVALSLHAEAVAEDCARAALVVTTRTAPAESCAATLIDRSMRAATGALALRRLDQRWEITAAHPDGTTRPWSRPAGGARPATGDQPAAVAPRGAPGPDATPRAEDLETGD
ncbi:MAG: ComEC/Rec2 family competence protein [Xanthobacteraceae bacterium]